MARRCRTPPSWPPRHHTLPWSAWAPATTTATLRRARCACWPRWARRSPARTCKVTLRSCPERAGRNWWSRGGERIGPRSDGQAGPHSARAPPWRWSTADRQGGQPTAPEEVPRVSARAGSVVAVPPPSSRAARASSTSPDPAAPVHVVTGAEELLAERAVQRVLATARGVDAATQVIDVEAAGYARGDLAMHASPSLFGERKVLVVRGLEDASDDLITDARALVDAPEPDVVLVLRHRSGQRGKGLLDAARKAGAAVHDCPKITTDADKTAFVQREFRAAGRRIDPDAIGALVEAVGQDVRELASGCSQLMADTVPPDGRPQEAPSIDVDVVERYYGGRVEATGFKVADAALAGETDQALALL